MLEYTVEDRGYRTPCWILPASHSEGYARLTINGVRVYAHRAIFEAVKGPIPRGMEPDHRCRQRACCNPDHLQAVTRKVNARRGAKAKLTQAKADVLRRRRAAGEPVKLLAAEYGIAPCTVSNVAAGRGWT